MQEDNDNKVWVIRAGRDGLYVDDFVEQEIVAIGWSELGFIDGEKPKSELLEYYKSIFPDHSSRKAQVSISQIIRFLNDIAIRDHVVTYDRDRRSYYIGEIVSEPLWEPEKLSNLPRVRKVKWKSRVSRDQLGIEAKNTLGAIQTLFLVKKRVATELLNKAISLDEPEEHISSPIPAPLHFEDEALSLEGWLEKAKESIEEHIVRLDWESMQHLVAGILRAMGYRTTVSPRGADRGVDIFASPDGLGLEDPRIFVEVKHRPNTAIGSQDIRSFLGGRNSSDKCLYVSTGGFTKDARYEADRANVPLQLIALTDLRRLLVDNYEELDEETRAYVPLRRVYVLAEV